MKKDKQKTTKNDKNSIVESLDDLIDEGINITRHAQEGNAIYHSEPSDVDFLRKVHLRCFLWKESIKKLLNQEYIIKEININFFYEADSVPDLYGGLEYGNVQSEKSQTLLKNIRIEASKKLEELVRIKDVLEKKYSRDQTKISLKDKNVNFNDDKAIIKVGDNTCQLPPYKNEHYFCRAVYEYDKNEPIDWSVIFEKITGYYELYYGKPLNKRENWRIVYDALEALNKRIKNCANTDDNLFTWQEKTVKRNH